jgi:hypothetical protein
VEARADVAGARERLCTGLSLTTVMKKDSQEEAEGSVTAGGPTTRCEGAASQREPPPRLL